MTEEDKFFLSVICTCTTQANNFIFELKVIPVAIGREVGPGGIIIPPYKVIVDPEPDVDKPDILVQNITKVIIIGKREVRHVFCYSYS